MVQINPEFQPILDMFGALIKTPKVHAMLRNWEKTVTSGLYNFGTSEQLDENIKFNVLFLFRANPRLARDKNKIELDPEYEIAGVISDDRIEHKQEYNYLPNEILVVKAFAKWDFAKNEKFKSMRVQDNFLLNMPEYADPNFEANALDLARDISKMCKLWVFNNRLKTKVKNTLNA